MHGNSQNRQPYTKPGDPEMRKTPAEEAQVVDREVDETAAAANEDHVPAEAQVSEKTDVSGVVTDCVKLNVRKNPDAEAEVLTVVPALSEVMVDLSGSTDTFYKVCTAAGIEGFCMKQYIAIHPQ